MSSKSAKILLTGFPGCGKTTAVMKIIDTLDCEQVAGFYTQEIRQNNIRKGFSWKRLDGADGTLAHINIKRPRAQDKKKSCHIVLEKLKFCKRRFPAK